MPPKAKAPVESESDKDVAHERAIVAKSLELTEAQENAKRLKEQVDELRGSVDNKDDELRKVRTDSNDILRHLEKEMQVDRDKLAMLEGELGQLQVTLEAKDRRIAELTKQNEGQAAVIESAQIAHEEYLGLKKEIEELNGTIRGRDDDLRASRDRERALEIELAQARRKLEDMRRELARSTSAVNVSGCQWTLKKSRHPLIGRHEEDWHVPLERERNSFVALQGVRAAVLFGGTRGKFAQSDCYVLNMENYEWTHVQAPEDQEHWAWPCARGSHCAVPGKKRMLLFGGKRNPLLNDLYHLACDAQDHEQWQFRKEEYAGDVPAPNSKACAAWINDRQLLLVGGETEKARDTCEGWLLDTEKERWQRLEFTGTAPVRTNMTVTASGDGCFVYAFGGRGADGKLTNELAVLTPDKWEWTAPGSLRVMGSHPCPREGHAAVMVDRYLVVAGGWCERGRLSDCYVLDTQSMCWEVLDGGTEPLEADCALARSTVLFSEGRRVLAMTVSTGAAGDRLDEVFVQDVNIPEEAFASSSREPERIALTASQLQHDARSVVLEWQTPPGSKVRPATYKLFMSMSGTPLVKEVYSGADDCCRVPGCRPGNGYQFRVKGEAHDGSFLWSDICEVQVRPPGAPSPLPDDLGGSPGSRLYPQRAVSRSPSLSPSPPRSRSRNSMLSPSPLPPIPGILKAGQPGTVAYGVSGR